MRPAKQQNEGGTFIRSARNFLFLNATNIGERIAVRRVVSSECWCGHSVSLRSTVYYDDTSDLIGVGFIVAPDRELGVIEEHILVSLLTRMQPGMPACSDNEVAPQDKVGFMDTRHNYDEVVRRLIAVIPGVPECRGKHLSEPVPQHVKKVFDWCRVFIYFVKG